MQHRIHQIAIAAAFSACGLAGTAQAAVQADEPEEAALDRRSDRGKAESRICVQQTGSRITAARNARSRSDERECVNGGGRVYSRDDIESTGSPDLRDALRRLDPAIN